MLVAFNVKVSKGALAVYKAAFMLALKVLVSLDNIRFKVIPIIYNHPFYRARGALALAAYP
jgi:hypothetical protein